MFADGEALLRREYHPGMVAGGYQPAGMQRVKIRDIKRVQDALTHRGVRKLLFVGPPYEILLNRCHHWDAASSECSDKVGIHSVFIKIDTERLTFQMNRQLARVLQ